MKYHSPWFLCLCFISFATVQLTKKSSKLVTKNVAKRYSFTILGRVWLKQGGLKGYQLFERSCQKGGFWLFSGGSTFHFMEIQFAFCSYHYNRLEFFNRILQLGSKVQQKYFETPTCACANCNYSLLIFFTIFFLTVS